MKKYSHLSPMLYQRFTGHSSGHLASVAIAQLISPCSRWDPSPSAPMASAASGGSPVRLRPPPPPPPTGPVRSLMDIVVEPPPGMAPSAFTAHQQQQIALQQHLLQLQSQQQQQLEQPSAPKQDKVGTLTDDLKSRNLVSHLKLIYKL